jgi:hypothetical protein
MRQRASLTGMQASRNLATAVLVLATAGCASNYDFTLAHRPSGEPDLAALQAARAQVEPDDDGERELLSGHWLPFVRLSIDSFGAEPAGEYLEGERLLEFDSVGPLFMNLDADTWLWDEHGELYERSSAFVIAWGLFAQHETVVRVPSGWRCQSRTRWLWIFGPDSEVRYKSDGAE